ncbi:hypothetical protein WA026_002785 [Henosepilachna vigintioctopunctata]|uniref:Uncharacterized protein n=1 Tax=Henosepilachna vigintioctopunctata TaxID=420089 RepID=A0AAW1U1Q0_9CUCU
MITEIYSDDILVPTSDTMRNVSILNMHVSNNVPILLLGPTGQGKTLCIKHFINHVMNKSKFSSIFVKCIPRLTPKKLQSFIKSSFIKKISFHETKSAKKNLIVIEDLNVITLDKFKVSSVIEFLRQILDHSFWYDGVNFEKKYIENLAFVSSMGSNGELRKNISPRLMKHFSIFYTNNICSDNIQRIFTNTLVVVWKQNGFASDIALLANTVVNAFWCIYEFCCTKFRSSPLKFSYSYSIWDFRKALSGLFLLKKESADANKKIYQKLWIHECIRVFGDRLVETKEKNMLFQKIIDTYENTFKESLDETFNGINAMDIDKKVIFGCTNNLRYEEIELSNISEKIREILKKCPILGTKKLVLFDEFLMQVVKISRILSIENSNVLIMGMHGTGRKTLTEIASIMHNCHLFVPPILYKYNISKWHENFKKILLETGGRGNKGVMYLNEEHFKYQFILEDINSFLKNGDLIDLFEIEEEPMILNLVRLDAQHGNPNLNISSESVYAYFVNRCREKLHIIMSFSCESNIVERRIHLFQSLTKFCTAIWFNEWSDNAIMEIANEWIKDSEICDSLKVAIPEIFVHFYQEGKLLVKSVFHDIDRKYSISTAAYIEFLEMFVAIMNDELIQLNKTKEKYLTGLRKLKYADNQIRQLQESLAAYQLQLKIMTKKAAQMTRQIAKESLEVERASDLVKKDEQVANKQAEAAAVLKLDCEADLAQAIPILEDAIQALNTLKPSDITLVKSMKNPPDAIKLVMAAVCVIKDVKPDRIPDPSTGRKLIDYWGPSKRILGDMNFLQTLKDFDKDHIKSEIMVKIRKDYLPHKDFKPHVVAKASSAAEGLCKWIIAMDMYDNVAKEVAPKKDKLEKAEKEYAQTIAILNEKKAEVDRLEKQLAKLSAKLQEANKRQNRVQRAADRCNAKLERSLILISGFENEKIMWTQYVTDLNHKRHCLVGDVILTSATISYLSAMPVDQRRNILKSWHYCLNNNNVPRSDNWRLDKNLTSMGLVDLRALPEEDYFIENCIIYNYSYKSPLFIDPHGMAKKWIERTIDKNLLHIIKYRHSNLVSEIEYCLKLGKYLLVENIGEEFTSAFNTLLHKDINGKNSEPVIIIEGKQFIYDKNFKLFMTTTLRSPNHKSQLSNKVKIINFSLTKNALQKKLLNVVIKTENALVGKQMNIYKKKNIANKNLLQKYEEKILKTLSEAENDLLEDNKALKILDDTKKLSEETGKNNYISEKFVVNFEKLKVHFSEFSHHASMLFFCIEDFWKIKGICRFSVQWFLRSYRQAILEAPLSGSIEKRVQNVTSFFIYKISRMVLRMVHEKDVLNFLFHLSFNILIFRNEIDSMEIEILYKREKHEMDSIAKKMLKDLSNYGDYENDPSLNKVEKFASQQLLCVKNIEILEKLGVFKGLQASMKEEKVAWESFLSLKNPEKHQLPGNWTNKLNTFQKFLLVQTLRADRTNECIKTLVSHVLGEEYIQPKGFDFEELYSESFCLSPILLLTSDNNSPLNNLKNFAVRKKFYNKFRAMCLSETNIRKAENLIQEGQKGGLWICLINCHLTKSWLFQLESICEAMTYENTNENFRLWLISDISFKLPDTLVEKCVKIIYEYSESFKENLLVSYKDFSDDINIFEYQKYSHRITRLIYRVICFHWVILWRQKYESLGWNYPFNFSNFDLKFATMDIPHIVNTFESDEALKFFIGKCSYSGQMLDQMDHKLSNILIEEFLSFNYLTPFSFPAKNDVHDFTDQIKKLPSEETADMICCNNIVLTRKNINESRSFTSYILSIGGVWNNNFDGLQVIEMVDNILQLLNVEIENKNTHKENNDSLKIILQREIQLHVKLVMHIKHTLLTLRDLLSNNHFLPPYLQDVVSDLCVNKISKLFFKYSFMTVQNFSSYIHSLRKRLLFFKNWNDNGTPDSFWISSFFYPNSFLSLQNTIYAQKVGEPITNFSNIYAIQRCPELTNGINIYGLYLMNAKYKKFENSVELLPEKVYFDPMPSISIIPVFNEIVKSFICPVYRINSTASIEKCNAIFKNFIFSVHVQSTIQDSTLTKLGVSLTCECP